MMVVMKVVMMVMVIAYIYYAILYRCSSCDNVLVPYLIISLYSRSLSSTGCDAFMAGWFYFDVGVAMCSLVVDA